MPQFKKYGNSGLDLNTSNNGTMLPQNGTHQRWLTILEKEVSFAQEWKPKMEVWDLVLEGLMIVPNKDIEFTFDDGRKVDITFAKISNGIAITETFEPESQNPADMQR